MSLSLRKSWLSLRWLLIY